MIESGGRISLQGPGAVVLAGGERVPAQGKLYPSPSGRLVAIVHGSRPARVQLRDLRTGRKREWPCGPQGDPIGGVRWRPRGRACRRGRARYRGRGEVLVVDGTLSQVDMVFRPATGRLATVMAEMQRRDDPQCERKFLRKVLAERSRGSAAARIAPYMLYAEERVRARAARGVDLLGGAEVRRPAAAPGSRLDPMGYKTRIGRSPRWGRLPEPGPRAG